MKKLLTLLFISFTSVSLATEGMWIPSLIAALNEDDMQTMGMRLTAEDLYSVNNSSIKDAIVHFNGGCTAEVISKEGLILTNHHCGYGAINSHSTLESNYLKDGFWAMSKKEELKNPSMVCTFVISIEQVTDELYKQAAKEEGKTFGERFYKAQKTLEKKSVEGTHYTASIKGFNYGNDYFLIKFETFKDIRLVGAPPSSIGKYGFDTDNWVWPRHTGDFSLFRIYAGTDNKPADYSENNVPYTPKHSLPISLEDRKENDFTMVYGFPGTTEQYLSSYEVDFVTSKLNPMRIKMRETSLNVINAGMMSSELINIQYASKQSRIANAWKKWVGANMGLERFNAVEKKQAFEKEYLKRAYEREEFKDYRKILDELKANTQNVNESTYALWLKIELFNVNTELFRFADNFAFLLSDTINKKNIPDESIESLQKKLSFFKNYNAQIDHDAMAGVYDIFKNELDEKYQLPALKKWLSTYPTGKEFADYMMEESLLMDSTKLKPLVNSWGKKSYKKLIKDPAINFTVDLLASYDSLILPAYRNYGGVQYQLMGKYVKGIEEMFSEKIMQYDANSTLRLTYGKVEGSSPRDGMAYTYYTTMDGVMDKYIPGDYEYDLPKKLVELAEKRDYGQYAQEGELFVCFTGSNHTTGGNSGSPCLNKYGHLIGLNFDRSWESTMSDIMFDPEICRNIMVDIRYVLFIVDKFAGAKHLIEEMNLIEKGYDEKLRIKALQESLKVVTAKIKSAPNNSDLLYERAIIYKDLGMLKEYELDINAAHAADKKGEKIVAEKAEILMNKLDNRKSNLKEALTILNYAILKNPNSPLLYYRRAMVKVKQDLYKQAVYDFNKVTSLDPSYFQAYYNRGVCYHLIGNRKKGCDDFRIAQKVGHNQEYWIYESVCE
jgi:tetratricopeptide (TPR) repeat protein